MSRHPRSTDPDPCTGRSDVAVASGAVDSVSIGVGGDTIADAGVATGEAVGAGVGGDATTHPAVGDTVASRDGDRLPSRGTSAVVTRGTP